MVELQFKIAIDLPRRGGSDNLSQTARQLILKLAAELVRCSIANDDDDAKPSGRRRKRRTTKRR